MTQIINLVGKWKGVIQDTMSVKVSVISGWFLNSSNEDKGQSIKPVAEWEKDFQLWSLVLHIAIADSLKLMKLHSKC